MLVYYAVFGMLAIEAFLLVLLLLPISSANRLGSLIVNVTRQPLYIVLGLLALFTVDQTMDMRKHQLAALDIKDHGNAQLDAKLDAKMDKFRTERNFYLSMTTTVLLVILLRLASVVKQLDDSQSRVRSLLAEQVKKKE